MRKRVEKRKKTGKTEIHCFLLGIEPAWSKKKENTKGKDATAGGISWA